MFRRHPIELLVGVGHVESHFGPFGDSVRLVHDLRQAYYRLRNRLGRTRWYSLVTRLKWKLDSVYLERVLTLMQDRCTVYVECTIGLELILDAPMDLLGDVGHVEPRFNPF